MPLIELQGLKKNFSVKGHCLSAVSDVDLQIFPGETLGLVGESGCGKSTIGKLLVRLQKPSGGQILYQGKNIDEIARKDYSRQVQIIFQDPYSTLNPRMNIESIIREGLDIHSLGTMPERQSKVMQLMELVGLSQEHLKRYPHEFSGGQRQRIAIARALALEPQFLICDEPLSALDVSIQAQIIALLQDLQKRLDLTLLFISHDLSAVATLSHRIAVMYLGKIVEIGPAAEICSQPRHPYTQALFSAIPIPDPIKERQRTQVMLSGDLPSPFSPPQGCVFQSRCPFAIPRCGEASSLRRIGEGHLVACHLEETGGKR